ncbi:MAG: DUF2752 domain-containing protein [Acidimicrobiales bacterium]
MAISAETVETLRKQSFSSPERFALTGAGVAVAATAWPMLMSTTGVGLPCPLRALTGIPCPFCGMTTASIHLARGRFVEAVAANPLVLLVAIFTLVMFGLIALRRMGHLPPPSPWRTDKTKPLTWALSALAMVSWVFQLNRLDLI